MSGNIVLQKDSITISGLNDPGMDVIYALIEEATLPREIASLEVSGRVQRRVSSGRSR